MWNQLNQTDPTNDERIMATVAHALSFVEGGIIGPLILYVIKKDESRFVAFHSWQSLLWGLGFLAVNVVIGAGFFLMMYVRFASGFDAGALLIIFVPLFIITALLYFVYEVVACIRAYHGEWYELPFVGISARHRYGPDAE